MKIWLDDVRSMPAGFTHWCRTAAEAIALLATGQVTVIDFDHDLWDNNPNGETGATVANWIEREAFKGNLPPLSWGIHSSNPAGRKNIILAMLKAEVFWEQHQWSFETRTKETQNAKIYLLCT